MAGVELNEEERDLLERNNLNPSDIQGKLNEVDKIIDDFLKTAAYERSMDNEPGVEAAIETMGHRLEGVSGDYTAEQNEVLEKLLETKYSKEYFSDVKEKMDNYLSKEELDEMIVASSDDISSLRDEMIFLDRATFDDSHGVSNEDLLIRYEAALGMYNAARDAIISKVPEGLHDYVISSIERDLGIASNNVFVDSGALYIQLRGERIKGLVDEADNNPDLSDLERQALYEQALGELQASTYEGLLGENSEYLKNAAQVDAQYLEDKIDGIDAALEIDLDSFGIGEGGSTAPSAEEVSSNLESEATSKRIPNPFN